MSSKFRIELPDNMARSRALVFAKVKRDLRVPIANMSDAELVHLYDYILSCRRVQYLVSEIDYGFDNDLYVIDVAAARIFNKISKVLSLVAKCIYGSIVKLVKRILYIFRRVK